MARAAIGLDIGTSAVRAAQLKGKDPPTLVRFAQLALPPGAVVEGEINDAEAVASVIRDLWRRGDFRGKQVSIAVANQNVVVRQVDLPRMSEEELRGALRFQVQDYIPIPVDDALLDCLVLDEFITDEGAGMMRVLTVAALKDMIGSFVEVLDRAGLEPVLVDLAPFAAVRALVDPVPSIAAEREAEAIVDIGSGITNVVVHAAGVPRFVRILTQGGGSMTGALIDELHLDREDAEARKIAAGVPHEEMVGGDGVAGIVDRLARAFVDEVQASIEFYRQQPEAVPIARAIVTGGGSRLSGLVERLSSALHLPVERGAPFGRVTVGNIGLSAEQLDQSSAVAAVAVGLALEE